MLIVPTEVITKSAEGILINLLVCKY